ncbi:bifunctional ATP-dependent DNA helicase/ssDNA endodeoxyribonuclease DNA2 NDAI_0C03320 [Naumovozyma dairenensis CBS 421]|uniref:DNA replication ATP-dependent helicase/nuclease n=1 Tax=Naumovozyma dairenensis (strain ATCC 10597 / BCRC 20456 / CBS 421 / NBRC 0211 / NRRL Y-12639) TaxID=1071378 RepID=G0W881_NAUDC|nr:hypothetical protein NDAI_0C03320 [Naumovozyma dairenensis CBS 421]CCD23992.1 hypothetical protein NDAI_0C03320 [Naumovozyma dairenensis CBS 421]
MPKTPERTKRSAEVALSPNLKSKVIKQKVTKQGTESSRKRKRKYQFAPVDNLDSKSAPPSAVLKSIPVSQVRNTIRTKRKVKTDVSIEKVPVVSKIKEENESDKIKKTPTIDDNGSYKNGKSPAEQVIWKYSPAIKHKPDDFRSSPSKLDDPPLMDNNQDPSSTPIIANKWKTILNFNNMKKDDNVGMRLDSPLEREKGSPKGNTVKDSLRGTLRDIDDILGDIEGDLSLKPNMSRIKDELPSSPSGVPTNSIYCTTKKTLGEDNDSLNEGDDSLIDILTQHYTQKLGTHTPIATGKGNNADLEPLGNLAEEIIEEKKSAENTDIPNGKDTSNDADFSDSLLDLMENSDGMDGNVEPESEVRILGDQISKNLKVKSDTPDQNMSEYVKLAQAAVERKGVTRLVILEVRELTLPRIGIQKILSCINSQREKSSVIIRRPWSYLEYDVGDVIHIIEGKNIENKRLLSDDINPKTQLANDNLLILNPDLLFSATSIGGSIDCLRRSVIQASFNDPRGEPSIAMTIGNIVHELLQDSFRYMMSHELLTIEYLDERLDFLLESFKFDIMVCNESLADVKEQIVKDHAENILQFVNHFVQKSNYGCYVSVSGLKKTQPLSISDVIDIEENIWSSTYGLKGYLDLTVEANTENIKCIAPLEVKTGKYRGLSHEAQGLIYTLLLNDKYDLPVDFFLLYYTRDKSMTKFPKILHSIKHILMLRNQMATTFKHQLKEITNRERLEYKLPPLAGASLCENCNTKDMCMVLNKLAENGNAEDSKLRKGEYELLTNHLLTNLEKNRNFFLKFNDLITKEESSVCSINAELFLFDSKTRESLNGRCLSNLIVDDIQGSSQQCGKYTYSFKRQNQDETLSMLHSQIGINDYVIISDENGHFSLCQGLVTKISSDSITVAINRKLLNNKITLDNGNRTSIQSVIKPQFNLTEIMATQNLVTYRIDKNDIQQNLSSSRFNILNLFLPSVQPGELLVDEKTGKSKLTKRSDGGDERMRRFIVDNESPTFVPKDKPPLISYTIPEDSSFNENQIEAIDRVMRANDYALILGMPGSGKTTVISELIKMLVADNKSVLLTSYTHSAVDNILLKLKDVEFDIIRLGSKRRVHPDTQRYLPKYDSLNTYEELLETINGVSVVATTCLSLRDIMFNLRSKDFDYVILDEASQISIPVALGPLRFGIKFVMVGDHYQLPPLVKNEAARSGGLEESLFKYFCERQPDSVVELTYQYRMCEDIVMLSNYLIYENKLKCGTEQVKNQSLHIPHLENLGQYRKADADQDWLMDVLDPQRKVIFMNYDKCVEITEQANNDTITNVGEAELTRQCVKGILTSGVSSDKVGVMTLYRAQLKLLKKVLGSAAYDGLEILTADQFQGRDKDCIIISMVRSNAHLNGGSLLKELRRVNVAMTRAKSKLIIIGSQKTISSIPEIKGFMNLLQERNWIYDLSTNCLECYDFPQNVDSQFSDSALRVGDNDVPKKGAKNITAESLIVKNKPITKQTLTEM